jgi:hypothetical protein
VFDIGRAGPDRERFDQFVARIIERINSLQSQAVNNPQIGGESPA